MSHLAVPYEPLAACSHRRGCGELQSDQDGGRVVLLEVSLRQTRSKLPPCSMIAILTQHHEVGRRGSVRERLDLHDGEPMVVRQILNAKLHTLVLLRRCRLRANERAEQLGLIHEGMNEIGVPIDELKHAIHPCEAIRNLGHRSGKRGGVNLFLFGNYFCCAVLLQKLIGIRSKDRRRRSY